MINLDDYKRYFIFKNGGDMEMIALIHPYLLIAFADLSYYASKKNMPSIIVTRVIDERLPESISDTHMEGRAIDVSVSNLVPQQYIDLVDYCNMRSKYRMWGAVGINSGKRMLCVLHASPINHLHLQIGKDIVDNQENMSFN